MNKRTLVFVAAGAMAALIAAAFAYDCVRLATQSRARVELADQELAKHEQRLVKLLADSADQSPALRQAIAAYRDAADPSARHAAYDQLVAAVHKTAESTADATNPLARTFTADLAGAINRREIAEPPYDAEVAVYREYLAGTRGAVARWFSPQAGVDAAAVEAGKAK
jgi:predicted HD phosphohydrolase